MRILALNSTRAWGGAEVWFSQFCSGMAERGHEVTLACHPNSELQRRFVDHERVRTANVAIRAEVNPLRVFQLARLFRRLHPDILVVERPKDVKLSVAATWLSPSPVIVHAKQYGELLKSRLDYRFFWKRGVKAIVAASVVNRDETIAAAEWLQDIPIVAIPQATDTERFRPLPEARSQARDRLQLPADSLVLSYHGRLAPLKRVDVIIDAVARVSRDVSVHALIIGGGGEMETLRSKAQELSAPVTFLGFRDDLPELLSAADVALHLSVVEGGTPFSVIEAMACGLPVIASDTTSHPEVISDGVHGYLVTPDDPEALAGAIRKLLSKPERLRRMGEAARERAVAEFSIGTMIDRYDSFLRGLVPI